MHAAVAQSKDSSAGDVFGGLVLLVIVPAIISGIAALGWWTLVLVVAVVVIGCVLWIG